MRQKCSNVSSDPFIRQKIHLYYRKGRKKYGSPIENESFDELGHEISLVKGCPSYQSGGTPPLGSLAAPADPEESVSHHLHHLLDLSLILRTYISHEKSNEIIKNHFF